MSFQQTIEDLYTDISLIKEYICREKAPLSLLDVGQTEATALIAVPSEVRYIGLIANNPNYLSRIVDRDSGNFDKFTYEGYGHISFMSLFPDSYYLHGNPSISSIRSIWLKPLVATHVALVPSLATTLLWRFYG